MTKVATLAMAAAIALSPALAQAQDAPSIIPDDPVLRDMQRPDYVPPPPRDVPTIQPADPNSQPLPPGRDVGNPAPPDDLPENPPEAPEVEPGE